MRPELAGKNVAVYGLGKSGRAAIRLLLREGARVTAVDQASEDELGDTAKRLRDHGVRLCLGSDPFDALADADLLVVSPGVPLSLPPLQAAREAGLPVWGEVELG